MPPALPAPLGQRYAVGGHHLHALITGTGGPAVVLEAGGASWSLDWHRVQTAVAAFTQTVSYDRAGFGWSDPGPRPRTAAQIAAELHTLLRQAQVPPPYVLVGASFGGHVVRLLARAHPGEVAGLVLLDPRPEALNAHMPPGWKRMESAGKGMYQVLLAAARLGVLPLLGKLLGGGEAAAPGVAHLPPDLQATYLAVGFQAAYFRANLDELAASAESDRQVAADPGLGALPLTVLRHGLPDLFARLPAAQQAPAEQAWQALQAELAARSTAGALQVAERSGHAIQLHQPDRAVQAIRQMVEQVRAPAAAAP